MDEEMFLEFEREKHNKSLPFEEMVRAELDRLSMRITEMEHRQVLHSLDMSRVEEMLDKIVKKL